MPRLAFKRILVTGGDGFVGSYLIPALERAAPDAEIFLASFVSSPDSRAIPIDLTKFESVETAVIRSRPDLIIHLAAQSSGSDSEKLAAVTWNVNAGGTLNLATAVARHAPDATFFFVSTAEVYGKSFNDGAPSEKAFLQPASTYTKSKVAAEAILRHLLPQTARLIIVRPSNHTGPRQDDRFVVPRFAKQVAAVEAGLATSIITGNRDAERDFLDVRDVIDAYVALLAAQSLPSEVFNIVSGRAIRVGDILKDLQVMANTQAPIEDDPDRMDPSSVPTTQLDISLIEQAVGWRPHIRLSQTLADVLNYERGLLSENV